MYLAPLPLLTIDRKQSSNQKVNSKVVRKPSVEIIETGSLRASKSLAVVLKKERSSIFNSQLIRYWLFFSVNKRSLRKHKRRTGREVAGVE